MKTLNLYYLVLQNLRRKPYRSAIIGLCVAVAAGSLFAATILLRGIETSLTVGEARLGADLVVVPQGYDIPAQEAFITGEATSFVMDAHIEEQIGVIPAVEQTSPQVFVKTLTNAKCCIGEFFLIGFDPATDFTISPWLATNMADQSIGPFDIIAGDRILLRPKDSATFFGTNFTVAGVLEKTGMGIDRTIYVPIEGLREMIAFSPEKAEQALTISPDEISSVLVRLKPGADVLDAAEDIEAKVSGVKVIATSHLKQAVGGQINGILGVSIGVTSVLWVMSLLLIGLVFSLIGNERQREFGLLRAMGAKQNVVLKLVVLEASALTGLGGLLGIVSAGILLKSFSRLIQVRLGIPYLVPGLAEVYTVELGLFLLSLFTGILASIHPALSSSKMEPYEAIRGGE